MRGGWARPKEEEEGPVSATVVKKGPRSDPDYVLHSQNPAECASANGQTGLTNGVHHKGLLQSKHKIRVDFKVSFFFFFFLNPLTTKLVSDVLLWLLSYFFFDCFFSSSIIGNVAEFL